MTAAPQPKSTDFAGELAAAQRGIHAPGLKGLKERPLKGPCRVYRGFMRLYKGHIRVLSGY